MGKATVSLSSNDFSLANVIHIVDILRGIMTMEQIRNVSISLAFLKTLADEDISNICTIPQTANWKTIVSAPNYCTLLHAWSEFDQHPSNSDFGSPFTSLGMSEIVIDDERCEKLINIVNLSHGRTLFESALTITDSYRGLHSTPTTLIDLIIAIAAPFPGASVYDPACGFAGILIGAIKSIKAKNDKSLLNIFGQDINVHAGIISRMALALYGISPASIFIGDSLGDPGFIRGGLLPKFDYVLSDPPIGVHMPRYQSFELAHDSYHRFKYGLPFGTADLAFLQHIVASLNEKGRAVIATGHRSLFVTGSDGEIRRRLIEDDLIDAVISLPSGILSNTSIPPAILVITKDKPVDRRGSIQFILADTEYEEAGRSKRILGESNRQKILKALRDRREQKRFSHVASLKEIEENGYSLIPAKYLPVFDMRSFLGGDFTAQKLSAIADILPGSRFSERIKGDLPVIQGRNLTSANLKLDDLERISIAQQKGKSVSVQAGDVLIQRIGNHPSAFLVPAELDGVIATDTVHIIRLDGDHREYALYLTQFLNSESGRIYLSTVLRGAVIPSLNLSQLRNLEIPLPKQAVTSLLDSIHQVEQKLLERIRLAQDLRSQLFSLDDAEQANAHLQKLSVEAKVLSESIIQTDDLNFRIRNFYPYPLAYPYRTLDALHNPNQLYPEQLRISENILAFLGSVGLILAKHFGKLAGTPLNELTIESLRGYWQGGISPGHWQTLARSCAKTLRSEQTHVLIKNYSGLWFRGSSTKSSEFSKCIEDLVTMKNDFKHDRGPKTDFEYRSACELINTKLVAVLKELAFLIQHPIRLVQDIDSDWRTQKVTIKSLLYTGDHPGLRQQTVVYPSVLPKQHLYVELTENEWLSLYPFISAQTCPQCKTTETYFIDFWEPGRKTLLKSFERGHVHEKNDTANSVGMDIQYWLDSILTDSVA